VNFRGLLAIVIIVVAAFAGLYLAFTYRQPQRVPGGLTNASAAAQNSTVLGYAEKVLAEARELYENAVEANKGYLPGPSPQPLYGLRHEARGPEPQAAEAPL